MSASEDVLVKDKRNVKVLCQETEDCIPSISFRARQNQEVKVTLLVTVAPEAASSVFLQYCTFLHPTTVFALKDEAGVCSGQGQALIAPGTAYRIVVRCFAQEAGHFRLPLALKFQEDTSEGRLFTIVRFLEPTFYEDGGDDLEPVEPYFFVPPVPKLPDSDRIIHGKRPKGNKTQDLERKRPLNDYPLDKEIVLFQEHGLVEWDGIEEDQLKLLLFIKKNLDDPISESTYWGRFSTLLFLEEVQMRIDIRKYDMVGVPLTPCPTQTDWYVLEVPGLVEMRPSVLKGDKIFVRHSCESPEENLEVLEYEGFVCETRKGSVLISFCKR
ncbi:hypothetical protein V5799_033883 [Amblyomma americanum]|uniref:Uncharacterized protein n=1 Tax=Amblyomma americanum TaxID=6943 RepID=A0AAQ4DM21_AMBAM